MLQELFSKVHRRYEGSRFAADLEGFAAWLRRSGYSRNSTCDHLLRANQTLERMDGAEPGGEFATEHLYAAFTSSRFPALYRGTQRAFERFLSSRGRLIRAVPDDPFAALRGHYLRTFMSYVGLPSRPPLSMTRLSGISWAERCYPIERCGHWALRTSRITSGSRAGRVENTPGKAYRKKTGSEEDEPEEKPKLLER